MFLTVERPYAASHWSIARSINPADIIDTGRCPSAGSTRLRSPAEYGLSHATPRCRAIADTVVSSPQRVDRPRRRPGGELGAGRGVGLDLGPGPTSTRRFGTPPDPLAPSHPHRPSEARSVVQQLDSAAVADRDHPAVRTASEDVVGLDLEQHAAVLAGGHIEDVHALDTEQFISPRTPPAKRRRRPAGTRRVRQRQGLSGEAAWSPPIVKALTPSQLADTPSSTPSRGPFLGGPKLKHHCRDAGEIATSPADYFDETVLISVPGHRVPGRRAAFTD